MTTEDHDSVWPTRPAPTVEIVPALNEAKAAVRPPSLGEGAGALVDAAAERLARAVRGDHAGAAFRRADRPPTRPVVPTSDARRRRGRARGRGPSPRGPRARGAEDDAGRRRSRPGRARRGAETWSSSSAPAAQPTCSASWAAALSFAPAAAVVSAGFAAGRRGRARSLPFLPELIAVSRGEAGPRRSSRSTPSRPRELPASHSSNLMGDAASTPSCAGGGRI